MANPSDAESVEHKKAPPVRHRGGKVVWYDQFLRVPKGATTTTERTTEAVGLARAGREVMDEAARKDGPGCVSTLNDRPRGPPTDAAVRARPVPGC